MKTTEEIISYLTDKTSPIPGPCMEDAYLEDYYCGNEDDARDLGISMGEYWALRDLLLWIQTN